MTEKFDGNKRGNTSVAKDLNPDLATRNGLPNQNEIISRLYEKSHISTRALTQILHAGEETIEMEGDDQ